MLPLQYFRVMRRLGIEVWMLVHARTRGELQDVLAGEFSRVHYVEDSLINKACWLVGRRLPSRIRTITTGAISHMNTQWRQRLHAKRLVHENKIDVIHEVAPVSPRMPSMMLGLGAPVVIGPMNGGMKYPAAFTHMQAPGEKSLYAVSKYIAWLANIVIPGKRLASALLVANERTRDALVVPKSGKTHYIVENAVDLAVLRTSRDVIAKDKDPDRIVYVGRLVECKCVHLLIQAAAIASRDVEFTLEIIGDGPERLRLEQLSRQCGIDHRVSFLGYIPHSECMQRLDGAAALVLPSVIECGGAVVLEAMSLRIPVIALRWGGPADYLDETCGILIEPTTQEAIVRGIASNIVLLISDELHRRQLGEMGRRRVEECYNWEKKVAQVLEVYRDAINTNRSKCE